jgi:hypothetical protein
MGSTLANCILVTESALVSAESKLGRYENKAELLAFSNHKFAMPFTSG